MAQPEQAAGEVGNPADSNPADAFNAIAEEMLGDTPQEEEEPAADEGEPSDELTEDDIAAEEEADDLPPIDAPVSWDAEAKAKFAELPRELQETVTKREAERERFVQQKSQEAARARSEVETVAMQQLAAYERQVAEQLQYFAAQSEVAKPDPALLAADPVAYAYQQRKYDDAQAQRQAAQQQAQQFAQQAQQREAYAEQVRLQQEHQTIVEHFPEYADPTTGPELQRKLSAVAKRIGYPDELISQARATDIIAMKKVADAFDKADRYDALQSKKMEKVRAAKGLPRVAKPGVSQGTDQLRANRANAAFETAKSTNNREVQGAAFYEYLTTTGHIKK